MSRCVMGMCARQIRQIFFIGEMIVNSKAMPASAGALPYYIGRALLRLSEQVLHGVVVIGFLVFASMQAARADTFDVVTKLQDNSASTVWRIDEPNVKQKQTNYPEIVFAPGDRVKIDAGGCVQTGGWGATWKLYVNPQGANSDHLYHGLIMIPGITNGLVRLQNFGLNADHQIADPLPNGVHANELFLRLGYEDDGYGDNGYYSHDDGNYNQCKNSVNAFVIVSIGHDGAMAPDPAKFIGITADKFRCQAAWAFHNFDTSSLSWRTYTNAFRFGFFDYIDPATYITYLAGKGMASGGNCAGMSLLADVGEDQFVVGDLKESFWQNFKNVNVATPRVMFDINTAHWQQLSSYFLHNWLGTYFNHPATNAAAIEKDLTKADFNYGLLTLAQGTSGHVLVPLRVSHSGSKILIDVYDPNRPCGSIPDTATYPKVIIENGNWSYDMGSDGIWSGSNGMGYIPYLGQDGWTDLGTNLAGLVNVIFGADVNVEQITDSKGRRMFVQGKPGQIDFSESGLGHSVMRLPHYGVTAGEKRPRSSGPVYTLNHALTETPAISAQVAQLEKTYGEDYANSGMIYLVTDKDLTDLTFTLSGKNAAKPVRALIRQGQQFFEMRAIAQTAGTTAAGTAAVSHPALTLHGIENLANTGMTVKSLDAAALSVNFTHGAGAADKKSITLQQTEALAVSAGTKVRLANNEIEVSAAGNAASTKVSKRVIDVTGKVVEAPVREMILLPLQVK